MERNIQTKEKDHPFIIIGLWEHEKKSNVGCFSEGHPFVYQNSTDRQVKEKLCIWLRFACSCIDVKFKLILNWKVIWIKNDTHNNNNKYYY